MQSDKVSPNAHFLAVQLMFMSVWFVSQSQSAENALKWATVVARYIVYLLTSRGLQELCVLAYRSLSSQRLSFSRLYEEHKLSWITYAASALVLLVTNQRLLGEDFPLLFAAFLICQFLQTEQRPQPTINYGTGMACSFFEGYLKHVIPSDGKDDGFVGKIRKWENAQNGQHKEITAEQEELTLPNDNQLHLIKEKLTKEQLYSTKEILRLTKEQLHLTKEQLHLTKEQLHLTKEQLHLTKLQQKSSESIRMPLVPLSFATALMFYAGELLPVLESDGKEDGFVKRMEKWENKEGVVFPVKKLLLVITKSLYCPPNLSEFNNPNRHDLPQIEPCVDKSLEEVCKDVAGVMRRRYSNTTYVIRWLNHQYKPVYLAAECATPLHTLYGVLNNNQLYRELVDADREELVRDFVTQLQNILDRSPATMNKCKLVFFDDSNGSKEYLPNVLLKAIEEIESNYREIIDRHDQEQSEDPVPIETPPRVLRHNILNNN